MANELRVRQNFLGGKIEDNPLAAGATTLTSAALAAMVAIGSTQHMPVTLDPDGLYGEPEIVYITSHTTSATTATISRGQEGTTARAHQRDVDWTHGPTLQDFPSPSIAASTGSLTLTTSVQDVPGCSLTTTKPGTYLLQAFYDFDVSPAIGSTDTLVGEFWVGGAQIGAQALFRTSTSTLRAVIPQVAVVNLASGTTVKLRAYRNATTSGTALVNPSHTNLVVVGPF